MGLKVLSLCIMAFVVLPMQIMALRSSYKTLELQKRQLQVMQETTKEMEANNARRLADLEEEKKKNAERKAEREKRNAEH